MNIFITGMTGTGKTYAAHYLLRDSLLPVFAFSNKDEDFEMIRNITNKNFQKVKVNSGMSLKYLPQSNVFFVWGFLTQDERISFIDKFALLAKQENNIIVLVDEAHEILSENGKHSRELETLIAGGRAKNIQCILISQRPQNIIKSALNNCKWKLCFKLSEPNAIRAMVANLEKVTEEDIKNLKLYEFYIYNAYTGDIEKTIFE
ncbi:MAG: AAA family ATPase [Candidatus Heimdallarchaeaceae archaeon]